MNLFALVVQPSSKLADLIASKLAGQFRPLIEKELKTMSDTLQTAVASLQTAAAAFTAAKQADESTIADLRSQLAAAQAGDPEVISAIDAVTAELSPPASAESNDQG